MKRHSVTLLTLFVFFGCLQMNLCFAEGKAPIFSTWEGFEVDKCASIWLIKRFVDKNAVIKFHPKGENIKEGIPFDTPDAKLRRYHNMSTFQSILESYKLQDSKLKYIGRIIYDIEINIWERKVFEETPEVQEAVTDIIIYSQNKVEIMQKSIKFFDLLYEKIVIK